MLATHGEIVRPGYTSNYTEADRKNGVSLDFVFVLGVDNPDETTNANSYQRILSECQAKGLKYVILGDEKNPADLNEISKIPQVNNVVLDSHGRVSRKNHVMQFAKDNASNTLQTIHTIQAQTNCKNFFVCACYRGKVVDDFKNSSTHQLQEGTFLSAYSAPDEVSWSDDAARIHSMIIKKSTHGEPAPVISISADLIKTIPQTMAFAYQQDGRMESETLMRNSRRIYHQAEDFCTYQLSNYNHFINGLLMSKQGAQLKQTLTTEFPHVDFDDYIRRANNHEVIQFLELNMTEEEIEQFQDNSIQKYILHNDTEVLKALLSTTPSIEKQMLESLKNDKYTGGDVLRILLEHRATQKSSPLDLTGYDLSKANLTGLDLNHTNLTNAKLHNADLTHANLTGANLTGANLSGAKGVTSNMLLSAASLLQTQIDAQQFKVMSSDEQVNVKKKIADDYINYINKIDSVAELAILLSDIAKNEKHPLKFKRIGLDDYGDTTSYAAVINQGRNKLAALLNDEHQLNSVTDAIRPKLNGIANINVEYSDSFLPSFLRSQPMENSAEKLKAALAKMPTESVFDAINKIEKLPDHEQLPYAEKIANRIEHTEEITYILDVLPEQDRLPYAKWVAGKVKDIQAVKSIIELLPEKDQLNYAILMRDRIKNVNDVVSILRRLPEQDQLAFAKNILHKITNANELKWLSEQKISNETKKLIADMIQPSMNNAPNKAVHPTQSTSNIFAHLVHDEKTREKVLNDSSHHLSTEKPSTQENKTVVTSTTKKTPTINETNSEKEDANTHPKMGR